MHVFIGHEAWRDFSKAVSERIEWKEAVLSQRWDRQEVAAAAAYK